MSLLRPVLISFSKNSVLQQAITQTPISRRAARRFIAGETLEEAVAAVLNLNAQGLLATLDHLGENVTDEETAIGASQDYILALEALRMAGACCNISVKLTQMGLDTDDGFCLDNVRRVAAHARQCGNFVRIDMEGSEYTERTLVLYRRLRREFDNVGIVIQAYLLRSEADVRALIAEGIGHFRLCKGAYDEPASIAYKERECVIRALNDLVRLCMDHTEPPEGAYPAIASHDVAVINFARAYAYRHNLPRAAFEFQMLYGIRRELQMALARQGYRVRVYVPYGTHWYPYYMRRLAERPANLIFFLRALIGR